MSVYLVNTCAVCGKRFHQQDCWSEVAFCSEECRIRYCKKYVTGIFTDKNLSGRHALSNDLKEARRLLEKEIEESDIRLDYKNKVKRIIAQIDELDIKDRYYLPHLPI